MPGVSGLLTRLRNQGNLSGIIRKIAYKNREAKALVRHGSASFPSYEEKKAQKETVFHKKITFSILVPVWNNDPVFMKQMLDSVLAQTYAGWELCIADGSDPGKDSKELCSEYNAKSKGRIKYKRLSSNAGIAGNTNECLKLATGEYIGLLDQDDLLHPCALYEYAKAIEEQDADYLYCDEVTFVGSSPDKPVHGHFKPDYAPDNLLANNYICHFSCFCRRLLEGEELFREIFDGAQDHDMILRLTAKARHVVHVPKVLYYWRNHTGSSAKSVEEKPYIASAAIRAIRSRLREEGIENCLIESTRASSIIFRLTYEIKEKKKISILLPPQKDNRYNRDFIQRLIEITAYPEYEILVPVCAGDLNIERYEESFPEQERKFLRCLEYNGESEALYYNEAARQADGYALLFLNPAIVLEEPLWADELYMHVCREPIGAVGPKLVSAEHTIEHAGIILGQGVEHLAGYSHYGMHVQNVGYMGRLCYAQNVSAVSLCCLMLRKEVFWKAGGFDGEFTGELMAVDLCLRLRQAGYRNLFNPYAEFLIRKSLSQDAAGSVEVCDCGERFYRKWSRALLDKDPYYNRNFRLDCSDFSLK